MKIWSQMSTYDKNIAGLKAKFLSWDYESSQDLQKSFRREKPVKISQCVHKKWMRVLASNSCLLASLNVSKRQHMYYSAVRLSRWEKIQKVKKKYCEKADIILIRHSDTLLFISLFNKTVHLCISLPSQTRSLSRVDPYLWHYKKIKKQAYTPHM